MSMESRKILGVRVDFGLSVEEVLNMIESNFLTDKKNHIICTTNPEFIMDAQKDEEFKEIINKSSLSVPDGIGVIFAKKFLDKVEKLNRKNIFFPIIAFFSGILLGFHGRSFREERVSGVDLVDAICKLSSERGYSIFFLGGRGRKAVSKMYIGNDKRGNEWDVSTQAAEIMRKKYPGVNIIGATTKYNRGSEDDEKTVNFIKNVMEEKGVKRVDFLFVAYNHNYQEKWIMRNKDKIPAKISIGCGGAFDFIVGNCSLPTDFYVKNNLEWLYRLIKQPWRFKRVIKAFPLFPIKLFLSTMTLSNNDCK